MPLLEVVQTRYVSASVRLTDTTAIQLDQYAAFIHAAADEVIDQALAYVFSKDRDFNRHPKRQQRWWDRKHDPAPTRVAKPLRCCAPEEFRHSIPQRVVCRSVTVCSCLLVIL
jgi:hypothetical protein